MEFTHYLDAKRSVDYRSLSEKVAKAFGEALGKRPLQEATLVLELGCGTGAGAQRLLQRGVGLDAQWTLLDQDPKLVNLAVQNCTPLVNAAGLDGSIQGLVGQLGGAELGAQGGSFHAVTAQAVLDLFPLPEILPWIAQLGAPQSYFYLTLNFDGLSLWEPVIDQDLDDRIALAYHNSMDERITQGKVSGDSRSGRHLFTLLPAHGLEIVTAASSDWAVWPQQGRYPAREAYFLECILEFYATSLAGRHEISPRELQHWLETRRDQILGGKAVFLAHQWDFLAQKTN